MWFKPKNNHPKPTKKDDFSSFNILCVFFYLYPLVGGFLILPKMKVTGFKCRLFSLPEIEPLSLF